MSGSVIEIINKLGVFFCDHALRMLIQSSILIAAVFVIDLLIRKRIKAVLRYYIWLLVFTKLVTPTTLSLPTGIGYWLGDLLPEKAIRQDSAPKEIIQQPQAERFTDTLMLPQLGFINGGVEPHPTNTTVLEEPVITPAAPYIKTQAVLFLFWLIGELIFIAMLLQRTFFVRRIVAESKPAESRLQDLLNECCMKIGIRKKIELKVSKSLLSPAACGLLKPRIILPSSLLKCFSLEKLRTTMLHELAHIKRKDIWINSLQTFLQIFYFYNPLLWFANIIVRRIREQAVDETVLVYLGEKADTYSRTLVDIAEIAFAKPSLGLNMIGVVESKKALTARIKHILARPFPKTVKLGITGLAAIILAALMLIPMAKAEKEIKANNTENKAGEIKDNSLSQVTDDYIIEAVRKELPQNYEIKEIKKSGSGTFNKNIEITLQKIGVQPTKSQYGPIISITRLDVADSNVPSGSETTNRQRPAFVQIYEANNLSIGITSNPENIKEKIIAAVENIIKEKGNTSDFKTTLPNGVTVELLGVCEHPSEGKKWWRPDGTKLEKAPYEKPDLIRDANDSNKIREFAIHFGGSYSGDANHLISGLDGEKQGNTSARLDYVNENLTAIKAVFSKDKKSTTVPLYVTAGQWETRVVSYGKYEETSTLLGGEATFRKASEENGKSTISMSDKGTCFNGAGEIRFDSRIIAKDIRGNVLTGKDVSLVHRGPWRVYIYEFEKPLEQITFFEYQTRPYYKVEFENVTLEPGEKTDVKVKFNISGSRQRTEIQPVTASTVTPLVWITYLPTSPIHSLADYQHSQKVESLSSENVKAESCELEIRSASDNKRIARIKYDNSPISGGRWGCTLNKEQIQEIGVIKDGTYLAAIYVNGIRCSNVAQFTVDSKADLSKELILKLVPLPLGVGQALSYMGIIATGPNPTDTELEQSSIYYPDLFVDGIERKPKVMKWAGPNRVLQAGTQGTAILDLENYTPAIELNQPHEVWAKLGKYQSATVVIPASDTADKNWDEITKKFYPATKPDNKNDIRLKDSAEAEIKDTNNSVREKVNPEDVNEFGAGKSEPIYTGYYFDKGKYIDVPYIVERRGLNIYINDILVRGGPISELYDYSVDTDPGDPPPGVSLFGSQLDGTDLRDNYFTKKWRYLSSHYDYETATKMMFNIFKKCNEMDVKWSGTEAVTLVDKKTGKEIAYFFTKWKKQKSKNELIESMEEQKRSYEEILQNDLLLIANKGFSLLLGGSRALDTIRVLISEVNDSEKFKRLDEGKLIQGCQEELPWIVTDFEASSQLAERVRLIEAGYDKETIADMIKKTVFSSKTKPEKEVETIHKAKYNEVGEFIKRNGQQNTLRYNETREVITKDDLPILYELLDDDEYAPYWHKVVKAIGFVSNDPESVNVLLKFLQRNDISKLDMNSLVGKTFTLNMMGLIGGDKADSILRKGATEEGALELSKEWIDEKPLPIPSDTTEKHAMINRIQQHSYLGLIFSGKPENIAFVEKIYNEQKKISISNHKNTELMTALIDTMATKDLIAEEGLAFYLNLIDATNRIGAKEPYIEKYSFSLDEEDSTEAAWRAKYSDIRDYVKLEEAGGFYQQGIEMFDVNDLPILYELLKDDNYAPYWHNAAGLIGFLSDEPNIQNSVAILLDYFQRDDGNKKYSMAGKIRSLSMISLIGGDLADSVLRKAVTIEGARELAKNWIDNEQSWPDELFKQHKELVISGIQLACLKGLAYSGTKENHDYLERLYLEEKNTSNPSKDLGYRENLVSAMIAKAYIEEHDIGACIAFLSSDNLDSIKPYWEKFGFPSPEEDSAGTAWKAKYNKITEYITRNGQRGEVRYNQTRELITKDELPILYELLNNYAFAPYWQKVVKAIGYVSDDPNSVKILLKFIQRYDNRTLDSFSVMSKNTAFTMIGLIGGDAADSILRKSVTKEGAKELTKDWIDQPLTENVDTERMITLIQQGSFLGLLYSGKKENIALLEKIYNEEKAVSIKNHEITQILFALIDDMSARDYLASNNVALETYLNMSPGQKTDVLTPYINKYLFSLNEEISAAKPKPVSSSTTGIDVEALKKALFTESPNLQFTLRTNSGRNSPQMQAINQLEASGSEEAINVLLECLTSNKIDMKLKQNALTALGRIGTKPAIEAITKFERWSRNRYSNPQPFYIGAQPTPMDHLIAGPAVPIAETIDSDNKKWALIPLSRYERLDLFLTSQISDDTWSEPILLVISGFPTLLRLSGTEWNVKCKLQVKDDLVRIEWNNETYEVKISDQLKDTDKDGSPDIVEVRLTTDPNNPDSDSDGVPDGKDSNPLTPKHKETNDTTEIRQAVFSVMFAASNSQDMMLVIDRDEFAKQEYYGFAGPVIKAPKAIQGFVNLTSINIKSITEDSATVTIYDYIASESASEHEAKLKKINGKWVVIEFILTEIS